MNEMIKSAYGNKVRVRVCGICIKDNALLLVNHKGLNSDDNLWVPPGGGIEFGESTEAALRREFLEETGLRVDVTDFLFVNEFIKPPLHAIELFFSVDILNGQLIQGIDPEVGAKDQIIKKVEFVSFQNLVVMSNEILHNALHSVKSQESLLNMRGYFKFCQ
ncbi:NUDIX domain-containing protein [Fulvivirga sp. 29W222]|uniref:NUDIX domain-containing protein n=1 Tax=Fulvivirga marina TaxID=2494733 RepID=A0A937KB36_9BACT|nr:NUDIX domain-containing protein [Fulvivirga marina]MBL6445532.1 NUDIX domain-containing protein [Fulvivirga marina]